MRGSLRRSIGLLALVAFAASFSLPFLAPTHAWIDDPDAGWSSLPRSTGASALETATASREEHCAICHWMRALGSSLVGVHARRTEPTVARPRPLERLSVLVSAPADAGPARAPPISVA